MSTLHEDQYNEGRSNMNRPLSDATSEWARLGNDFVRRCGGDWGSSSPHHQTLPSPQLVEFKMSECEVPITIVQHVVIKFLTNENVGPNEIWRRLRTQYGESTLSKTQVKFWHKEFRRGRDAVQNTSHQRCPRTSITPREYRSSSWPYWRRSSAYCGWNLSGAWYMYQLWERAVHHKKWAAVLKNFGLMGTHDNARPHSAPLTQEKLSHMYWTALEHPPYSLDLSPCNCHMFGPLKEALGGQRFDDDKQVKNFVRK